MTKRGKPPFKHIDWVKVEKMCMIQCTGEEIAGVLEVDYDTLQMACKREQGVPFSEYIGEKKQGGKASLRRNQWKQQEDGNTTMQIWLGKQYLGQADKADLKIEDQHVDIVIQVMKDEEIRRLQSVSDH